MSAQRSGSPRRLLAWLLLLGLFALRFVHLAQDPILVSPSGMYLTDEGWYSKAAQNLLRLGHADASADFVPITHTFGYVLVCKAIFDLSGPSLLALRTFNLLLSGLGVFCLCWSLRARWGDHLAYCLCLGLLCNLLLISLTRLALPDTTAFALLTLALAAQIAAKQRTWLAIPAWSMALALSFIKTSYLPVTLCLIALRAKAHLRPHQKGLRAITFASLASCILPLVPLALGYAWIYLNYPSAWAMFSELNLQGRLVKDPLQWIMSLGYALGADLWSTGSLGFALMVLIHARNTGFGPFARIPAVQALGLVLGLNFLARSIIWYHPPRYGLVTALAILLLSLLSLQEQIAMRASDKKKLTTQWLGWGLLGQIPLGVALMINGYSGNSMQLATEAIVQEVHARPHHPKLLYGSGSASFVSLFSSTLQALDISDRAQSMCARVAHYGEGFLLVDDRKERDFDLLKTLKGCPEGMSTSLINSYPILNNYYDQGPWRLYLLSRRRAPTKQ